MREKILVFVACSRIFATVFRAGVVVVVEGGELFIPTFVE